MKISPINFNKSVDGNYMNIKHKSPNFGMALKITNEGKELLNNNLLMYMKKRGITNFLTKLSKLSERQANNPIDIVVEVSEKKLYAIVRSYKYSECFLQNSFMPFRFLKKAEKMANKMNLIKNDIDKLPR